MRTGIVYSLQDPPGSPIGHGQLYGAALDQAARAEQLGYDWFNLTEHHVTDDGYCPAVLAVLAAVAARTSSIGLSSAMLILPLHHPLRIAEEAAVVDLISMGRLTLGVAVGYRELEFEALGSAYGRRGKRMDEALEILIRAWGGESFAFEGETLAFPEVTVRPLPAQRPHPRLWIGGSSAAALRRAARHDSPLCPGATETFDGVESLRRAYAEIRADAGRTPGFDIVLPRLALVADTVQEARSLAYPGIAEMFERYMAFGGPPLLGDALDDWDLLDQLVIVGDENHCAALVARYRELGVTDLLLQFAMPTLETETAERSITAMARVATDVKAGRGA
jgi:probable F420-dependent oxidoreductase